MVRNAANSLACTRAWHPRYQVDERAQQSHYRSFADSKEITPELLGVEAHSEILHPEDSARVDDRRQKRMVDVAVLGLRGEHAVPAGHVTNDVRRTGDEKPAGRISSERLRIFLEHFWRVALGIDGNGDEEDLLSKVAAESILHERHHRRQHRTGIRAQGENEGHGDDLAAEVGERHRRAVLGGQIKFGCSGNFRQQRLMGGLLREVVMGQHKQQRCHQHRRQHDHGEDDRRPHHQPLSSSLSSLKNRQSVACARILLGVDLIMPASRSRSE